MKTNNSFSSSICILIAFIFSLNVSAQNQVWMNFTNGDQISDVVDEGNLLWIATRGGLVKYDKVLGNKTFFNKGNSELPRNVIGRIDVESNGNIWFVTQGGLSTYDGLNWTLYDTSNSGLPEAYLFDVAVDQNGIKWIASLAGLISYDGNNWITYDTSNSNISNQFTRRIFISPTNEKWIVTLDGIEKFDGSNWTLYDYATIGIDVYEISNIAFKGNEVYVSSKGPFGQGNGLLKFDGTSWTALTPANSGLPFYNVDYVSVDTSGNLWIANRDSVLALVKFDGTNWTVFPTGSYFQISNIEIDSNNRIFTGTSSTGFAEFDGTNFNKINTSNSGINLDGGGGYEIFIDDQNKSWITNYTGITQYDGQIWTSYDSLDSPYLNSGIMSITCDHIGNTWIGSNEGLVKFDGTSWTRFDSSNSGLGDNYVRVVVADSANSIWCGTNVAPFKFDGTTWTNYFSNAGSHINDLFVTDDADVWMGSPGYGLNRFDLLNTWTNYSPPIGGSFQAGAMDKNGIVWFGGSYLNKWDGNSWTTYTESDGLPWPLVTSLGVDTNNILWVGTQNGLSKFDGITFTNYFDENSPLTGNYIFDIKVDANNNKWIATSEGITVFNEIGIVLDRKDKFIEEKTNDIKVYPNPFLNKIMVEIKDPVKYSDAKFEICDLFGREVFTIKIINHLTEIQCDELSKGIYFYKYSNGGEAISTGKLIAE